MGLVLCPMEGGRGKVTLIASNKTVSACSSSESTRRVCFWHEGRGKERDSIRTHVRARARASESREQRAERESGERRVESYHLLECFCSAYEPHGVLVPSLVSLLLQRLCQGP